MTRAILYLYITIIQLNIICLYIFGLNYLDAMSHLL